MWARRVKSEEREDRGFAGLMRDARPEVPPLDSARAEAILAGALRRTRRTRPERPQNIAWAFVPAIVLLVYLGLAGKDGPGTDAGKPTRPPLNQRVATAGSRRDNRDLPPRETTRPVFRRTSTVDVIAAVRKAPSQVTRPVVAHVARLPVRRIALPPVEFVSLPLEDDVVEPVALVDAEPLDLPVERGADGEPGLAAASTVEERTDGSVVSNTCVVAPNADPNVETPGTVTLSITYPMASAPTAKEDLP